MLQQGGWLGALAALLLATTACSSDSDAFDDVDGDVSTGGASNAASTDARANTGGDIIGSAGRAGAGGSSNAGGARATDGGSSTGGSAAIGDAASDRGASSADGHAELDNEIPQGKDTGPSTSATRLTAHPLGGSNSAPNGFYEYLPPGHTASSTAPLLLFLHGMAQNGNGGSELDKMLYDGVAPMIGGNRWPDTRPFVVLMPQYSGAPNEIAPGKGCPSSVTIDAFLTWALAHYNIDPKQIYLMGFSCGAIGSWDYLADHTGSVVAATVLISGNPGDPDQAGSAWKRAGCSLGNVALWSLHGDQDNIVPYAPDHATTERLIACPNPPRRAAVFTTFVGAQHAIESATLDLSSGFGNIYRWLLDHAKP